MIDDCTGLILAGGDSARMGRDKAGVEFDGQTLLQRGIARLESLFPQVLVSVRTRRPDVAAPQVIDGRPDAGPLAGLCAGLAAATTPWVFAVAVDMPFVDPRLVRLLAARREADPAAQAVVPVAGGFPQPLAAFYAVAALPRLQAMLDAPGRAGLRTALEHLRAVWVHEDALRVADPDLRAFFDLDTPDDLAAAKKFRENEHRD